MSYRKFTTEKQASDAERKMMANFLERFPAGRIRNGELLSVDIQGNILPNAPTSTHYTDTIETKGGWAVKAETGLMTDVGGLERGTIERKATDDDLNP